MSSPALAEPPAPGEPAEVSAEDIEKKEFGSDFFRFEIGIPKGWSTSEIKSGCIVNDPGGGLNLSVQFFSAGDKSAMEYAKALAGTLTARVKKIEHGAAANEAIIYGSMGIAKVKIFVSVQYGVAMVVSASGEDTQHMNAILGSIKQVQHKEPEFEDTAQKLQIVDGQEKK